MGLDSNAGDLIRPIAYLPKPFPIEALLRLLEQGEQTDGASGEENEAGGIPADAGLRLNSDGQSSWSPMQETPRGPTRDVRPGGSSAAPRDTAEARWSGTS